MMQFRNITRAKVVLVEGEFYLELPRKLLTHMNISESDSFDISFNKDKFTLWKSPPNEVPQEIYDELKAMFKDDEQIVSEWLATPRVNFNGKAAIDLIDTQENIELIQEFIKTLKTGDFS
jgi:hypothetical protein